MSTEDLTRSGSAASLILHGGSPFRRLDALLSDVDRETVHDLTIGAPRHAPPPFVVDVMAEHADGFSRYPMIKGTPDARAAMAGWLTRRYDLSAFIGTDTLADEALMVLNGSREGLVFACMIAGLAIAKDVAHPTIMMPNPFYQAYLGGALAAQAEPVFLDASKDGLPLADDVDEASLRDCIAIILASPSNPQGMAYTPEQWDAWLALARAHDVMLFADECYADLYREGRKPAGLLEAAARSGSLDHVVSFHSLSKRSNLPGLRVGFMAGDPAFMKTAFAVRNIAAPQVPTPAQAVAAKCFADDEHAGENRVLYDAKFDALAALMPGVPIPDAGFFVWLPVEGDDDAFVKDLFAETGIRSLPGSYLGVAGPSGSNPGAGYVRVALVGDLPSTQEALEALQSFRVKRGAA